MLLCDHLSTSATLTVLWEKILFSPTENVSTDRTIGQYRLEEIPTPLTGSTTGSTDTCRLANCDSYQHSSYLPIILGGTLHDDEAARIQWNIDHFRLAKISFLPQALKDQTHCDSAITFIIDAVNILV